MGGRISLKSQPGCGSTFWFTIRLPKYEDSGTGAQDPGLCLQGVRVLIVDDNATNRMILHHQITVWGMANGSAEDGFGALDKLRQAVQEEKLVMDRARSRPLVVIVDGDSTSRLLTRATPWNRPALRCTRPATGPKPWKPFRDCSRT